MHKELKDKFVEDFFSGYNEILQLDPSAEIECWFDENTLPHGIWSIYAFTKGDCKMFFSVNGSILLDIFDVVAKIEEKFNIKVNGFSTYCGKIKAIYDQHKSQEVQNASS